MKLERNAAAEPQTEARRCCGALEFPLVTSARFSEVEWAWSRGRRGRPAARGAEEKRALVTAAKGVSVAFSGGLFD